MKDSRAKGKRSNRTVMRGDLRQVLEKSGVFEVVKPKIDGVSSYYPWVRLPPNQTFLVLDEVSRSDNDGYHGHHSPKWEIIMDGKFFIAETSEIYSKSKLLEGSL